MGSDSRSILKSTSLFSSCSDEDLDDILVLSGNMQLQEGDRVFAPGDTPHRLYIVESGEIVIRKDDDEGRPVDIARFLTGDSFGELDMFTGEPRNASAFAVGDTSLLAFPGSDRAFGDLPELPPRTSARLLHSFLVQVSARIRDVNVLVKENSPVVQELKRQVYVDKLTGLNNRTYFDEALKSTIASNKNVGLLLYKPDNFKVINDNHGHDAGDKVLRYIADRLRDFVSDRDMLFRYMGNENAVILPRGSRNDLMELAARMGDLLRSMDLSPILPGDDIRLSVSFGLALYPEHGEDSASLCDAAHPLTLEGRRRGGNLSLFPEDSEDS